MIWLKIIVLWTLASIIAAVLFARLIATTDDTLVRGGDQGRGGDQSHGSGK
jgi:hypothetical protein